MYFYRKINFNKLSKTLVAGTTALALSYSTTNFLFTSNKHARASNILHSNTDNTKVFAQGSGQYYQTGLGNVRNFNIPTNVLHLNSAKIVSIAAGGQQSMALSQCGKVYTFGRGEDARLGHGGFANESQPRLVEALAHKRVISIAVGERHCAAVTEDGELWTWGKSASYRLGHESSEFPKKVESLAGKKIVDVSCGKLHTLALTANGEVYSCGSGKSGCLGNGSRQNRASFEKIFALEKETIIQVSCGEDFSLFLTKSGKLLSCGSSDFGQTGHGQEERYIRTPRQITALKDIEISFIDAGSLHSAAVSKEGRLYTQGENKTGQLGHGDNFHRSIPHKVDNLEHINIESAKCGGHHTMVQSKNENRIFVFGDGRCGQLGRGDKIESVAAYRDKPVEITNTFTREHSEIIDLALGSDHSLALTRPISSLISKSQN